MAAPENEKPVVDPAPAGADASPADDEMHRKFREALEHKKSGGGKGSQAKGDGSKPHAAAGPAHQQRMFRRKSGG